MSYSPSSYTVSKNATSFSYPNFSKATTATVSYSSSNTDVATVDASTGSVTLVGRGTTTITASADANTEYKAGSASYTLNVTDKPAISFAKAAISAVFGGTAEANTLTVNPSSLTVTYTSSDENVAMVDNSGEVLIFGVGTAKITATTAADATNFYESASAEYTISVDKATPTIAFNSSVIKATIGQDVPANALTVNPSDLAVTYTSSKPEVADFVDGVLTLKAEGSTTITATTTETALYKSASESYTLNVSSKEFPGLAFEKASYDAVAGKSFTAPTLTNPKNVTVTYESSVPAVASVDASTGAVTPLAFGETVIKATSEATETLAGGHAEYTLKVSRQDVTLAFAETTATATMGLSFTMPALSGAPEGVTVNYSSTNEAVAAFENGELSIKAAGSATIKASTVQTPVYNASNEASFDLTVSRQTTSLSFSAATATADMAASASNSYPSLTVSPDGASDKVKYTSSNPAVATVNPTTGAVTLKGTGATTITASIAQDDTYSASEASYVLTVENSDNLSVVFDYTTTNPGTAKDGVNFKWSKGTNNNNTPTFSTNAMRFYIDNVLEISCASGYFINSISFNNSNNDINTLKESTGYGTITYSSTNEATWNQTSPSSSVSFKNSGKVLYITSITVTLGKIVKQNSSVEFGAAEYTAKYGETVTVKATATPADLAVSYSCDESKATVNATTGVVTPKTVGDVTITATVAGNAFFNGSSASTTVKVSKGDATLAFNPAAGSIAKGKTIATTLSNPKGLSISYTSSDETVATVATTGVITAIKAGSATITATGTSALYNDASATYSLTVTDKTPAGISFSASEFNAIAGKTVSGEPTLNNPHNLAVTYSSSDQAVATVSTAGKITAVGAGTATITASYTESDEYEGASVSYTITVGRQTPTFTFNPAELSVRLDDTKFTLPELSAPEGITDITYTITPASVASYDAATGELTLNAIGTATVKASMAQTTVYEAADATYTLTVLPKLPTFKYSASTATWLLDETNNAALPTLNKTAGLTDFSYTSSNIAVATVDANGTVAIVGRGKTTITASVQAQGDYDAATASYELTVKDPNESVIDPSSWTLEHNDKLDEKYPEGLSEGNITILFEKNGGNSPAFNQTYKELRIYAKNKLTFKAATGYYIKSIDFGATSTTFKVNAEGYSAGKTGSLIGNVWTASANTAPTSVLAFNDASSGNGVYTKKIIITLDDMSNAEELEVPVTFTPNAITAYLGMGDQSPTSSIPSDADVTYVSSAEAVVIVDASTGAITPVAEGTATITATINASSKYRENSGSYTVTVKKQPHGLAYEPASGTADMEKLGEFTSPVLKNEMGRTPISFSTSDATVATVDNNGVVTPVHKGKATITASFAGSDIVEAGSASYDLEVLDARIPVFDFGSSSPLDQNKAVTINNTTVQFSSTCSWQPKTGAGNSYVKFVQNGAISFKAPAGTYVKAVKLSFKDAVTREEVTPSIPTPASAKRRAASNRAGEYNVEKHTWTATAGTTPSEIVLTNTGTQINVNSLEVETAPIADAGKALPTVTVTAETATATLTEAYTAPSFEVDPASLSLSYESSEPTVATVNPTTGEVTLVAAGTTTIKAKTTEDADYLEAWASYELTVNRHSAELSFAQARYDGTFGSAFDVPELKNPHSLTVTAVSSEPTVADFVEGVLTLKSKGKTTITYSSEQTDTYLAGTASYILVVEDPTSPLAIFDYTLGKEPLATDANVTVEYQSGTGYDADNKALQIGKSNNCLFNAAEGYYITKLTVEGTQVENNANISVIAKDKELSNNKGTYDVATRTWTAAHVQLPQSFPSPIKARLCASTVSLLKLPSLATS